MGKEYIIKIQDVGIGILEEEQAKIFDKFYRVSEGNKHRTKGLGLGLYLSKELIEQLGGSIVVHSVLGQGSTFTVKLPIT